MNTAKTSSVILLFALAGCDRAGQQSSRQQTQKVMLMQTNDLVLKWVPMGTPLGAARQSMEQHQFKCSVISYNGPEQMREPGATNIWKGAVIRNGVSAAVTNVTRLQCKQGSLQVCFTLINGETKGLASDFAP